MPNNISSLDDRAAAQRISSPDLPALAADVYSQLDLDGLTHRQRLFVLRFDGRKPREVAADAGYTNPDAAAVRLMSDPKIRANVQQISAALERTEVLSSLQILTFWSKVAAGELLHEGFTNKDRLWCSEKLAKYHNLLHDTVFNIHKDSPTTNIVVQIADHRPTSEAEAREIDRLKQAVAVQAEAERAAMNKTERKLLPRSVTLADVL